MLRHLKCQVITSCMNEKDIMAESLRATTVLRLFCALFFSVETKDNL